MLTRLQAGKAPFVADFDADLASRLTDELVATRQGQLKVVIPDSSLSLKSFTEADPSGAAGNQQTAAEAAAVVLQSGRAGPARKRILFVNATSAGGGVAEMRFDSVAVLASLGFDAEWLVIDGSPLFFEITAHIHEAIQSRDHPALPGYALDCLQTVWLENFERFEADGIITEENAASTLFWIDDPQPAGLIPLIRAVYPQAGVVWRCHVDTSDPQPQVVRSVLDVVEGELSSPSMSLIRWYLKHERGIVAPSHAGALGANLAVFHREQFVTGSGLRRDVVPAYTMPPAVNPLAFKNADIGADFVTATLERYGVMRAGTPLAEAPPIACEISRFDPYKGPLECIVAFVMALRLIADKNPSSTTPSNAHLVFAGNIPGDNLKGLKVYDHCLTFARHALNAKINVHLAGPLADVSDRVHLLKLAYANAAEALAGRIIPLLKEPGKIDVVRTECMRLAAGSDADTDVPLMESTSVLLDHLVEQANLTEVDVAGGLAAARNAASDAQGDVLVLTQKQRKAAVAIWPSLSLGGKMGTPTSCLRTGKTMNHLEVNSLVTAAQARLQFSSREGFGLVVTEAMLKKPTAPYSAVVATLVGGITDQITDPEKEVALSVPYDQEEVRASLKVYQSLPEVGDLDEGDCRKIFDEIAQRSSVQKFADKIANTFEMPIEQRQALSQAAFDRAQSLFSTPANVRQILEAFKCAAPKNSPDRPVFATTNPSQDFIAGPFQGPMKAYDYHNDGLKGAGYYAN